MKKCIIYASVDRSREIDTDECPYCQVSRLKKIARKKNLKVDRILTDYCSKINQEKPILNQLLRDATNGKIQTILVQDYARMARSVSEWLVIKQFFKKQGVNIITAELEDVDSNGAQEHLVEGILADAVDEYDNLMLRASKKTRVEAEKTTAIVVIPVR